MKKLIFAGLSLAFFSGLALPSISSAQSAFNENVGCGLGSIIMKEKDTTVFQVLAVTTNGTFGNQTFGISSGTLECKQPSKFVYNEKVKKFVADNMDTIANDIAAGRGESLDTLAELMAIPSEQKPVFYASLQANFSKIYSSEKVVSADVVDAVASINGN
ncbi:MAG: DUF3015 family protein [Deltaproteobacteria bacterium]|nr:DUF3015 family protein [Deltaproteobacteria bacterium]